MKTSQKALTSHTTIAQTKTEITSSSNIIPSGLQVIHRSKQKRWPQRTVSIMEEATNKKLFSRQSAQINLQQVKTINLNHVIQTTTQSRTVDLQIVSVLEKILFKKKRYCFQVLKQFYLFPDQTQSSICSLSVYDPLVFQEEIIHSLVKIMETRLITNKIWGFINLKMMPFLKAAKTIGQKAIQIQQKKIRQHKKYSFQMIKVAAEDAISAIQKPETIKQSRYVQMNSSYLCSQNKQVQCGIDQKAKQRKSCLTSNLIHQQVRPSIIAPIKTEVKPVCESTTRVYTREQYELKYGKMKQKSENYQPKTIRISSPDYSSTKHTLNGMCTNLRTEKTSEYRVVTPKIVHSQQKPQIQVPTIKQNMTIANQVKEIKSPRKYNIIHYHERPREINHHISLIETKTHNYALNTSSLQRSYSPCPNICCCVQQSSFAAQSHVCCCLNGNPCYQLSNPCHHSNNPCYKSKFCEKYEKSDMVNETRVSDHVKFINEPKSIKKINASLGHEYELSQLESRIQYLNFLKSLVKEQELQESL